MATISPSSQKSIPSNKALSSSTTEISVIQQIPKETTQDVSTDNSVIEKILLTPEKGKRVRRQSRRFSGSGRIFRFANYPSLSGYASKNDRFPTVA